MTDDETTPSSLNPLAEIVQIQDVIPHPDADVLDLVSPDGSNVNYAIVTRGSMKIGDYAVWLDAMNDPVVPAQRPEFSAIAARAKGKPTYRIRAMKLRGVLSRGLLIPYDPAWGKTNEEVAASLGVTKWELDAKGRTKGHRGGKLHPGLQASGPDHLLPTAVYDLDGLPSKWHRIPEGAVVQVTEKIHGVNCMAGYSEHKETMAFRVRSRTIWKKEEGGGTWWAGVNAVGLGEKLKPHPGIFVYGEIFGQVQDLNYGQNDVTFAAFDVWDSNLRRWFTYEETVSFCSSLDIPMVPSLGTLSWPPGRGVPVKVQELAEGVTCVEGGATHTREGVVVRWDGEMAPGCCSWYLIVAQKELNITAAEGESRDELDARIREAMANEPYLSVERLAQLGFYYRNAKGRLQPTEAFYGTRPSRVILKLVGNGFLTR
jgi:RNA ligase (TIGR02306 family)